MSDNLKDKLNVVLALKTPHSGVPDEELKGLKNRFPKVDFRYVAFDPAHLEHGKDADVLYSYVITPQMFAETKRLSWFHSVVTGPDTFLFPELVDSGVKVTSPRGVYSVPIAETILGLMLALTRRIRDCIIAQQDGKWSTVDLYNSPIPPGELLGSKLLIVGLGGIGSALAERCSCLGMDVTGIVRTARECPKSVNRLATFDALAAELRDADFIVLACPLTDKTRGMIGRAELESMKPSAYLINVARGELVDEEALLKALNDGTIAGAASDVFKTEPLPEGHAFYSAPNMIVTPHVSGWSERFWKRAIDRFAENLERFIEGKALLGEVDFDRGY